ncbi:MAG: lysophospholipid acyltransferase family protein [Nitrospirota bacterium]
MFFGTFYNLSALLIRSVFRINGGLTVKGQENIPEGGVIIASNHISYLDPPLIGAVAPRRVTFMARKGLFEIPVLRSIIKPAAFPVDREKPRPSTIKEAIKRLRNGELLVIFPEGSRSETGELQEAKRGIVMIASMSKVPVVPALITGSNIVLPPKARWLKRANISVTFGNPLYYDSSDKGENKHNAQEKLSERIMAAIGELKKTHENNDS